MFVFVFVKDTFQRPTSDINKQYVLITKNVNFRFLLLNYVCFEQNFNVYSYEKNSTNLLDYNIILHVYVHTTLTEGLPADI